MKKTAKARTKAPPKPAKAKQPYPKDQRIRTRARETAPLLLALAVVDTLPSVDQDGKPCESIWLTLAKDQLSNLDKDDGQQCLARAEALITVMTAWGGK